jgi:hypothetical protein
VTEGAIATILDTVVGGNLAEENGDDDDAEDVGEAAGEEWEEEFDEALQEDDIEGSYTGEATSGVSDAGEAANDEVMKVYCTSNRANDIRYLRMRTR